MRIDIIVFMDNEKYILEEISNYKDIRRNFWTAFIVLTGGLATLFLSKNSYSKFILTVPGIIIEILLLYIIGKTNKSVRNFLNKLKNGD